MKLLLNSSPTALWHSIIHDAEKTCEICLKEDTESYLVFLLMRYTNKPELIKQIIATEFMQGLKLPTKQKQAVLQGVGDKCLIFAGLFPHIAQKRLVKISYFVQLGQTAYAAISRKSNDLYSHLAQQFVNLMDILQTVRHPHLLPLQAYELWEDTGSKRALAQLQGYSAAFPLLGSKQND